MKDHTESMSASELTCRELVDLVTDYLEDALPHHERLRFENHLAECVGCQRYLHHIRLTIATVGHLREEDLPAMARDNLLSVFRTWKQSRDVS